MLIQTMLSCAGWCLIAGLLLPACGDEVSYTLRWRFADQAPGPFSARNCGARGIESFLGTELDIEGNRRTFRAVCGMGEQRRSLPPGTWTVSLVGLDHAGRQPTVEQLPEPRGSAGPFVLAFDSPETFVEVEVPVRAQCDDGVDNDGNGLVDADDPSCQRDHLGPEGSGL